MVGTLRFLDVFSVCARVYMCVFVFVCVYVCV